MLHIHGEIDVGGSARQIEAAQGAFATLAGKALWEKGQEIGVTFTDPETENKLKEYMEAQ